MSEDVLFKAIKGSIGNAHSELEPIRRGSNINPDNIWRALDYLEKASQDLDKLHKVKEAKIADAWEGL